MYRNLEFKKIEQVIEEINRIQSSPVVNTTGLWSLYQIIQHLSSNLEYSMSNYPKLFPSFLKSTVGKIAKFIVLGSNRMRSGLPNPIAPKFREEGDAKKEIKLYLERIEKFKNFQGSFASHPIFDFMTKEEWEKLHAMHAAHHLSYVQY